MWQALLVAFAMAWFGREALAAPRIDSFSELPNTDTVRVDVWTHGCFHSSRYEFTFRRKGGMTVGIAAIVMESTSNQTGV
jgi:hypothetical protein